MTWDHTGARTRSPRVIAAGRAGLGMGLGDLVRPDLEADQRVRAKGVGNWHVSCVAALSDQHAADSRHVITRIEGVPPPAKIGLEPAGEIHRPIRWRHADVAEVPGAIAGRNVHATIGSGYGDPARQLLG